MRRAIHLARTGPLLICALFVSQPSRAAHVFTDQAQFRATVEGERLESFEELTPSTGETSYTLDDFTIGVSSTGADALGVLPVLDAPYGTDGPFATDGDQYLLGIFDETTLAVTFDAPVTAFGVSLTDLDGLRFSYPNIVLYLDEEADPAGEVPETAPGEQFVGLTSDTPFSRIRLVFGAAPGGDDVGIDEVYYQMPTIPVAGADVTYESGDPVDPSLVALVSLSGDSTDLLSLDDVLAPTNDGSWDLAVLNPGAGLLAVEPASLTLDAASSAEEIISPPDESICINGGFDGEPIRVCSLTPDDWDATDPDGDGVQTVIQSLVSQALLANGIEPTDARVEAGELQLRTDDGGLAPMRQLSISYLALEEEPVSSTVSEPASLAASATSSEATRGRHLQIGLVQGALGSSAETYIPATRVLHLGGDMEVPLSNPVKVIRSGQVSYHAAFEPLTFYTSVRAYASWAIVAELDSGSDQPPIAACKDVTVSVPTDAESCEASASIDDGSYDPDGDGISLTQNPSGPYPLGDTQVTLEVTAGGETDTCAATVTVVDEEPPAIEVTASPDVLWPPNHKMVTIDPTVTATDVCDESPDVELLYVTTNEGSETNTFDPNYDSTIGDGNTPNDIEIDTEGGIALRAERSGNSAGRVYSIRYRATDDSGNSAEAEATVTVPHSK